MKFAQVFRPTTLCFDEHTSRTTLTLAMPYNTDTTNCQCQCFTIRRVSQSHTLHYVDRSHFEYLFDCEKTNCA